MKKFLLLPLVGLIALVGIIYWTYQNVQPVSSKEEFKDFLIIKGSSAGQIGTKLQKEGLIRSGIAFKIYTQLGGISGKIVAGDFRLSPNMDLFQVVAQLQKGPVELWITIPEGLRREEIADRFAKSLEKDQSFIDDFLTLTKTDEGYLFPETYLFPKDATAALVVKKLKATYDDKTANLNPTKNQLILASLVERESKTEEERAMIAGILLNRLKIGMPLQVDATVQYVVGTSANWWPVPTRENLAVSSSFNTYKNSGLPPAPICNPGLSSIQAAVNPKDSDYFYYMHGGDGQIHYARTLAEHNANVNKYLTR